MLSISNINYYEGDFLLNSNYPNTYYWSPSVVWKTDGADVRIQNYIFKNYADIFPEFYFATGYGVKMQELSAYFSTERLIKASKLFEKLVQMQILTDNIQNIDALFYSQTKLFKQHNPYDESIKTKEDALKDFVLTAVSRDITNSGDCEIELPQNDWDEVLINRNTTRKFSQDKMSFKDFSGLLSILAQKLRENKVKYCYPSAGGLYPIDCYIYIKDKRVEKIDEGIFVYIPPRHSLSLVSKERLKKSSHYFLNQDIFESSSFSVFFFYNSMASMPKYDGRAYYYAIADTGIMMQALTYQAEKMNIGSCIIGDMDFMSIKDSFKLDESQKYLFCMEFGYKIN